MEKHAVDKISVVVDMRVRSHGFWIASYNCDGQNS